MLPTLVGRRAGVGLQTDIDIHGPGFFAECSQEATSINKFRRFVQRLVAWTGALGNFQSEIKQFLRLCRASYADQSDLKKKKNQHRITEPSKRTCHNCDEGVRLKPFATCRVSCGLVTADATCKVFRRPSVSARVLADPRGTTILAFSSLFRR